MLSFGRVHLRAQVWDSGQGGRRALEKLWKNKEQLEKKTKKKKKKDFLIVCKLLLALVHVFFMLFDYFSSPAAKIFLGIVPGATPL